jgi:hypothetical protein
MHGLFIALAEASAMQHLTYLDWSVIEDAENASSSGVVPDI